MRGEKKIEYFAPCTTLEPFTQAHPMPIKKENIQFFATGKSVQWNDLETNIKETYLT